MCVPIATLLNLKATKESHLSEETQARMQSRNSSNNDFKVIAANGVRPDESLGSSLIKIFDNDTTNTDHETVTLSPDVPTIEKSPSAEKKQPNITKIVQAELEPRYKPFEKRKPLDCSLFVDSSNLTNKVGTICNPCGVKCTGELISEFITKLMYTVETRK